MNIKRIRIAMAAVFGSIVIGALTVNAAQAGLFDSIATGNWPVKESDAYKVEAYGFDFRVYEWVTENDPNTVCTVAIRNNSSSPYMGMQCFKKAGDNQ